MIRRKIVNFRIYFNLVKGKGEGERKFALGICRIIWIKINASQQTSKASLFITAKSLTIKKQISNEDGKLFNYFSHLFVFSIFALTFHRKLKRSWRKGSWIHHSSIADRWNGSTWRQQSNTPRQHHLQLYNVCRVTMSTIFNFLLFSIDVRALNTRTICETEK